MENEAKDSLIVLAFHAGGSFAGPVSARGDLYSVKSTPTTVCDGFAPRVGQPPTVHRTDFNTRKVVPMSLKIGLGGSSYTASSKSGTVKVHITNTTGAAITGTMYVVLVETNIAYSWQGESTLYNVVRDMLPDPTGKSVSIPANGSLDETRAFTIGASCNASNCSIVVFIQASSKEIYQAARYKW
ncbi:MAG: Omp28-related outer membrane protein [bacterium]|nr:Omp28-related outer membrane protein [bacterium]